MVRPVRQKKPVNYSQFEDSDSDDDFVSANAPLHKKSRTAPKEVKPDKPKSNVKNLQVEDIPPQEKTPKKRMALDEKLYRRDLEVALALSVKELPPSTEDVQKSQGRNMQKCNSDETEAMLKPPRVSNCSVTSDSIDLDTITEEDDVGGAARKRKAASSAVLQQRKTLEEEGDGDSTSDTEPEFATSEDPTDDSDYGESEDNDENFTVRKSKVKEIKKRGVKAKSPGGKKEKGKKEKKSKSKCNASVTSVSSAASAIKTSQSPPRQPHLPAEAARRPLQTHNAAAESKRPKWVPPAASGCSSASSSPLAGATVKSPNQSLRLGLSRLARVKPLHPSAASS
ncbi:RAD51-associated protein 1 [Ochotona curzoniae]|uniref:RAD51-associated protein 1 n=1 Tax=Ochotona curzoniae TaxID=130825 RepID=UPI001B353733|nr:RAD51-associated protein 1 [Ochotona curzoniae]